MLTGKNQMIDENWRQMTPFHNAPQLDALYRELEDLLQGYGQDFAMHGAKPGVQRWGSPELVICIIAS